MAVINLFQNNIIDPKELMKIHKDPISELQMVDGMMIKKKAEFKKNHIPGAIFNLEFYPIRN